MKNKKVLIIVFSIIIFVVLLFPIRTSYKDGGTIEYRAILYNLKFWHAIDNRYPSGFYEATEFNIFPYNYLNQ